MNFGHFRLEGSRCGPRCTGHPERARAHAWLREARGDGQQGGRLRMLRGAAVEHKAPHAAPFMLQVSDHRLPGWPYCPSLPTKIRSQTCDCLEDDHECPGRSDDDDDDDGGGDDDDDDDKDEDGDCDVYGLLCRWSS